MKIQTSKIYATVGDAIDAGFTTVSAQGSSRSSKTYNILIYLLVYVLNHKNKRLTIVRKTLPSIKGSVFVDFKEILIKMGRWDEKALNKTDFIYHFPNGSWVEFLSTDNEQKIRGRKRNILYVNEANELKFIEWQQLKMRTTDFSIVDYNPSFSEDHWLCGVNADPRTKHFITTYKDNPFLEQTIIDEIESLQFKNKSLWQVYGLGIQAVIEGVIFTNIEIIEEIPEWISKRFLGNDFGYTNDPTGIVEVAIDEELKRIYVDEHCYRTKMLTNEIIAEFKRLPKYKVISECADPRLIDEIYNAGINIHPVRKGSGSIMEGITKMLEYTICITSRSLNAIKEGKWLNIPIDANNHIIDPVRYVILEEVLGQNRKKKNLKSTNPFY